MICEQWFPTPIWSGYLDNISDTEFKDALRYCIELKEKTPGRIVSNQGGWQSDILNYENIRQTPLAIFFEAINSYSIQAFLDIGVKILPSLAGIWVNINNKTDHNTLHNHYGSSLSGVFYLTQKNSAIIFKRDTGVPLYHLAGIGSHHDTPLSYKTATYNPIRGSFFLFPAWLDHWVEPNQEDDRRISIAFNYSYP